MNVVVITEALASRYFKETDPIGKRLRLGDSPWLTVVGVAGDVVQDWLAGADYPTAYRPVRAGTDRRCGVRHPDGRGSAAAGASSDACGTGSRSDAARVRRDVDAADASRANHRAAVRRRHHGGLRRPGPRACSRRRLQCDGVPHHPAHARDWRPDRPWRHTERTSSP